MKYKNVFNIGPRSICFLILILAVLALCQPVFAQGCSLCYTQAAQSGGRMIQALKSGILILIVPPTLLTLAMVRVCYRKKDEFHDPDLLRDHDRDW
jgi:hypothetical protein